MDPLEARGITDELGVECIRHRGDVLLVQGAGGIACFDLARRRVRWVLKFGPRRLRARKRSISAFGSGLWTDAQRVVYLREHSAGLAAHAVSLRTGREIWSRRIPLPPPGPMTETKPAWPNAELEDMTAGIAKLDGTLAILISRQSRRTRHWSPGHTVDWLPEYACQTEVCRLNPRSGVVMWKRSLPDVHLDILEVQAFDGAHLRQQTVCDLDWRTGRSRDLGCLHGNLSWPRRQASSIMAAQHLKGDLRLAKFSTDTGRCSLGPTLKAKRARTLRLFVTPNGGFVNCDSQRLHAFDRLLAHRWEKRVRPYVYDLKAFGTVVLVATDGQGGHLYSFDLRTGRQRALYTPSAGGVNEVVVGPRRTARATCADGVLVATERSIKRCPLEDDRDSHLAATYRGRLVMLSESDGSVGLRFTTLRSASRPSKR